jgi:hypothetical protein
MPKTTTSKKAKTVLMRETVREFVHTETAETTKVKPRSKIQIDILGEAPSIANTSVPLETAGKSAYEKGKEFEQAFANWLLTEQGYVTAKTRSAVFGRVTSEEPDVYAYKTVEEKENGNNGLSILFMLLFILSLVVGFYYGLEYEDVVSLLFFVAIGFVFGLLCLIFRSSKSVTKDCHVWAECKNIDGKVDKRMMQILIQSVSEVRSSESASWKPDIVMFAAANGFGETALALAKKECIQCYVPNGKSFQMID